jgi:hypothetical protein
VILQNKNAVIYGAGGSLGGAVAKALAASGAMEDIANLAVFFSSDQARSITGLTVDVTSGTTAGLNYRVDPISYT